MTIWKLYCQGLLKIDRLIAIASDASKSNLSTVFAGQLVGLREVEERTWLVSFLDYDPGFFDTERAGWNRPLIPSCRTDC